MTVINVCNFKRAKVIALWKPNKPFGFEYRFSVKLKLLERLLLILNNITYKNSDMDGNQYI